MNQQEPNKAPKVIAIDFDGCLFEETGWPGWGRPNYSLIELAKKEKARGATLILNTCREGQLLRDALLECAKYGLYFDLANENPAWLKAEYNNNPRKLGADEFWDNRAIHYEYGMVGDHDPMCKMPCQCVSCIHDNKDCCSEHGLLCPGSGDTPTMCPDYVKE